MYPQRNITHLCSFPQLYRAFQHLKAHCCGFTAQNFIVLVQSLLFSDKRSTATPTVRQEQTDNLAAGYVSWGVGGDRNRAQTCLFVIFGTVNMLSSTCHGSNCSVCHAFKVCLSSEHFEATAVVMFVLYSYYGYRCVSGFSLREDVA